MSIAQDSLDYSNDAQYRVCADTRCLTKKTVFQVSAGQSVYTLPGDVITIQSLSGLATLSPEYGLALQTGGLSPWDMSFFVLGRTLTILPEPSESVSLTMFYTARPTALNSDSQFEITGDFEQALDRLVQAMRLADDGQPELASEELGWYMNETPLLRGRSGRERSGRMLVAGFDDL